MQLNSAGKFKKEDFFYFLNVLIYFLMTVLVYYPRNKARLNLPVLYIYIPCICGVLFVGWLLFRKHDIPLNALIMVQVGILLHIIGGLSIFGARTYSLYIFGIGYDKIVHFYKALAGLVALNMYLDYRKDIRLKNLKLMFLFFAIVGSGAIVEIIEYIGVSTLPNTSVWVYAIPRNELYDNNLQDMIANFLGTSIGILGIVVWSRWNSKSGPSRKTKKY